MDIRKAFAYVFEDKQWITKLLIAVLLSMFAFLILPALIIQGFMIAIIRRVMAGMGDELPEWTDWGKLLKDGFFVMVAQIVYTLPFLILLFIGIATTVGIGSVSDTTSDLAAAGLTGSALLLTCLSVLFAVALLFIMPAINIQYARTDDFGACFRFGEVFGIIREHIADILIVFLVTLGAGMVIALATGVLSVIPCLGWIAAFIIGLAVGPYITFVTGHLYGQIGAKVGGGKAAGYISDTPMS